MLAGDPPKIDRASNRGGFRAFWVRFGAVGGRVSNTILPKMMYGAISTWPFGGCKRVSGTRKL